MTANNEDFKERFRQQIDRIVQRLKEAYQPEKIVLFGSCARGEITADSDIDMLIIKDTDQRPLDRMREVYRLVYSPGQYLAFEPLVYTPQEIAQRLEMGDFFLQEILSEGKTLYERE